MPFASTWTEELVAEWLQLENYLVETRLPGLPTTVGGRYEPDIVGARMDDGRLKIRHCEVAAGLIGNPKDTGDRYAKKFSPDVCQWVTEHFKGLFGIEKEQACEYEKWVIAGGFSDNMAKALREKVPDVRLHRIDDFIRDPVLPSIQAWQLKNRTLKGTGPTLPQGFWLLQLLEYMDTAERRRKKLASKQQDAG